MPFFLELPLPLPEQAKAPMGGKRKHGDYFSHIKLRKKSHVKRGEDKYKMDYFLKDGICVPAQMEVERNTAYALHGVVFFFCSSSLQRLIW